MIFYKGMSPFLPQSPKDGRLSNRGFGFLLQSSRQNLVPSDKFFNGGNKKNETLWISFFKGHQMKFEGSFFRHLLGGGGGGQIKNGTSQESVRSPVDECIKCTANNYATLSSCKSYLGE